MNALVEQWIEVQKQLSSLKTIELNLRKKVIAKYPGELGTSHAKVDKDVSLKITRGVSRTVDNEVLSQIYADLSDEEKECVVYKPSLSLTKYNDLPNGSVLSTAVTTKPSLPSIKVIYDVD